MNASGCDHTSTPTSCTPAGSGSANRTPSGSSAQASTGTSSARPAQRSTPVGPADDRVGRVVLRRHQPDRPRGAQEHRAQPVRRQVDPDRLPALEVELLGQQRCGLGHPVGVRRQRQLDALAGGVVVERDEGAAGLAPEQAGQVVAKVVIAGQRRGGPYSATMPTEPTTDVEGLWAVIPAGGAGTRLWPLSRSAVAEVPARPHRQRPVAAPGHRRPAGAPGRRPHGRGHRVRAPRGGGRSAAGSCRRTR